MKRHIKAAGLTLAVVAIISAGFYGLIQCVKHWPIGTPVTMFVTGLLLIIYCCSLVFIKA
jgi:hypothetical protein